MNIFTGKEILTYLRVFWFSVVFFFFFFFFFKSNSYSMFLFGLGENMSGSSQTINTRLSVSVDTYKHLL